MWNSFVALGPWAWVIAGIVLIIAEVALPGVLLLWFGLAAVATGLIAWLINMDWSWAVLVFSVLAVVFGLVGRRLMQNPQQGTDSPMLNRPGERLIGQTFTLDEPISHGSGRVRIGDSMWRLTGPDMVAGARIRVTGIDGATLIVEAANLA